MPLLTILNLPGARIELPADYSLLRAMHNAGFEWMYACGAKGRCTTCRLQISSGMENLTPLTPAEQRYRAAGRLLADERLACQVKVLAGAVEGRVPEGTQLPHVFYKEAGLDDIGNSKAPE